MSDAPLPTWYLVARRHVDFGMWRSMMCLPA